MRALAMALGLAILGSGVAWGDEALEERESPRKAWRIAGWVAGGIAVGAVGLWFYGIHHTQELSQETTAKAQDLQLTGSPCMHAELRSLCDRGERWETISMTSMLTAGLAIGASIGLLWYGYDDEGQKRLTVAPAPGGATVLVTF